MWNAAWGADNLYFQNITMFEIPETETYPSSFQYSISHPWERDFYIELCIVEMVEYIIMMKWNKVRIFPTFGSRPRDSFFIWLLWLMFTLREHIFPFVKEWKEAPAHQIKKMNIVYAINMRNVGFSHFWVPVFFGSVKVNKFLQAPEVPIFNNFTKKALPIKLHMSRGYFQNQFCNNEILPWKDKIDSKIKNDPTVISLNIHVSQLKRKQMQQSQCVKKCGSDRGQGLKSYLENVQMSAESYLTQTKALYTIEYNNTYVQRHSFSAHFHSA